MSFGFSIGDVISLSALAWNCYKSCRDSSEQFQRISGEVGNLKAVLDETIEAVQDNQPLSRTREERLMRVMEECQQVLIDLEKLLNSYESMNTQTQRTWDRFRFGMEDVAGVRSRLISHTTTMGALSQGILSAGVANLHKKLNKYAAEHRAGFRQGSVLSLRTNTASDNVDDDWPEIKRELQDVGIPSSAIDENCNLIKSWLRQALQNGLMDEGARPANVSPCAETLTPPDLDFVPLEIRNDSPGTSGTSSDSGLGTSPSSTASLSERRTEALETELKVTPASSLPITNDIFNTKWSQYREQTGENPDITPSLRPTIKRHKSSRISSLMFKVFSKDEKILEAASDGDANKVERLISLGANVNVRDRWGWTAMSMAAYGGHVEVARVLISHKAQLDNVDVDQETPLILARNRGHRALVMMIEEETTRRATEEDWPTATKRRDRIRRNNVLGT